MMGRNMMTFQEDLKISGWGRTLRDTGPESADPTQWIHKLAKRGEVTEDSAEFAPIYDPKPLGDIRSVKKSGKVIAVPRLAGKWNVPAPPHKAKMVGLPSEVLERASKDVFYLQQLIHILMVRRGHWESNAATAIMILRSVVKKNCFRQPIYWNIAGPVFDLLAEADTLLAESFKMGQRKAPRYRRKITRPLKEALSSVIRVVTMQANMDDAYSEWHETSLGLKKKREKLTGKVTNDTKPAEVIMMADVMPPSHRAADGMHGEDYGEDGLGGMHPFLDPFTILNLGDDEEDEDEEKEGK